MNTLKKFFVALCLLSGSYSFGQQQIVFSYDQAGNRVKREILMKKSAEFQDTTVVHKPHVDDFETQKPVVDNFGKMKIKIFPNPTKGQLRIVIEEYPLGSSGTLSVFTLEGKILRKQIFAESNSQIDISDLPNGIYLFCIALGDYKGEWKIVKE